MGRSLRLALLLVFTISAPTICVAQQDEPADSLADRIDAVVRRAGIDENEPGVAVLVLRGGEEVYKQAYGLADVEAKRPITPHTTFELASCSKHFTGLAAMLLVERGLISLDDEVRRHVPELPQYNADRPVRIEHLVHHTSGIPDYLALEMGVEEQLAAERGKEFLVNDDCVKVLARNFGKQPQAFPTGERFEYSNSNYMLLATVVERVSKKSFGEFLRDEIFTPLDMKTAAVNESPDAKISDAAIGYGKDENGGYIATWGAPPHRLEKLLSTGDGAVWCSLDDLAAYDRGLRAGKLIKLETLEKNLKQTTTNDGQPNGYAFGWLAQHDDAGNITSLSHSGSWAGFLTQYHLNLAGDFSIIVLSNRPGFHGGEVVEGIAEILAGAPPASRPR